MKLLVNPVSYNNAIELLNLNIDMISIGTNNFCIRNQCLLSIEQIKKLVLVKKNTCIYLIVNKIFFESEIDNLQTYLIEVCKCGIDGIIFSDFAVCQILYENNINNIKLIYNSETLVVNYGQFEFFLKNNINSVFIANELNRENVNTILKNKNNMSIYMKVAGYVYMMQSR